MYRYGKISKPLFTEAHHVTHKIKTNDVYGDS